MKPGLTDEPIYDYHSHLNPREMAEDPRFANLSEIGLGTFRRRASRVRSSLARPGGSTINSTGCCDSRNGSHRQDF
ncbi:glucuronate isomerase [Pantoea vagans]|nr:glucuronate isomerase [Pantoea vagans]